MLAVNNPVTRECGFVRIGTELKRHPFRATAELHLAAGAASATGVVPVPSGRSLVIENATGEGFLPMGQICVFSVLTPEVGALVGVQEAAHEAREDGGRLRYCRASATMRLCAEGGTKVTLRADRDVPKEETHIRMSISGYLVEE